MVQMQESISKNMIDFNMGENEGTTYNDREAFSPMLHSEREAEPQNPQGCQQSMICSSLSEMSEEMTRSCERIIFNPGTETFEEAKTHPAKLREVGCESSLVKDYFCNSDSSSMKLSEEGSEQSVSSSDSVSTLELSNSEDSTRSPRSSIALKEGESTQPITAKTKSLSLSPLGLHFKWEHEELLRLRSWMTCICLIDFDLSLGQTMKFAYPSGQLTESEGHNIASLAFPDSHNSDVGCYSFCFRFRTSPKPSNADMRYPYLFGFAFFCQKPDSSIKRGYFQKSVVLVSHLPYTKLFLRMVEIIGPLFFRYGRSIFEASCRNISQWPCPTNGGKVALPILGEVIKANLQPQNAPPYSRPVRARKSFRKSQLSYSKETKTALKESYRLNFTQMLMMGFGAEIAMNNLEKTGNNIREAIATSRVELKEALKMKVYRDGIDLTDLYNPASNIETPCGVFQDINLYEVFQNALGNLWFLWECAITGQPTMVVSKSPEVCTRAVLGVMSLISPLIYAGDFRPYFTVYDPDFMHFQELAKNNTIGCVILGVTNPFFLKVFKNWGSVLYLSASDKGSSDRKEGLARAKARISEKKPIKVTEHSPDHLQKFSAGKRKHHDEFEYSYIDRMVSRHTTHVEPNREVLQRILKTTNQRRQGKQVSAKERERISAINTTLLRRYFRDTTNCFLRPFYIYFTWNKKLLKRRKFNPYLHAVRLLPFCEEEFLDIIRKAPKDYFKKLPFKGKRANVVKFYSKFLRSPHFQPWFYRKREQAQARLIEALNRTVMRAQLQDLLKGMTIRNGVTMYRQIQRRIKLNHDNKELTKIMNQHLKIVARAIPDHIPKGKILQKDKALSRKKRKQISGNHTSTSQNTNPT